MPTVTQPLRMEGWGEPGPADDPELLVLPYATTKKEEPFHLTPAKPQSFSLKSP